MAEEVQFDAAACLALVNADLGGERLLQCVLRGGHVGIDGLRRPAGPGATSCSQPGCDGFDLTDRQSLGNAARSQVDLLFGAAQPGQRFGVARVEFSTPEPLLDLYW